MMFCVLALLVYGLPITWYWQLNKLEGPEIQGNISIFVNIHSGCTQQTWMEMRTWAISLYLDVHSFPFSVLWVTHIRYVCVESILLKFPSISKHIWKAAGKHANWVVCAWRTEWRRIPMWRCRGMHTDSLSWPKGKAVNHTQKEIDDVCGAFSKGAKEVFVPEA